MNILTWNNFSKRINSTKQPTGGTSKTVLLKDETDIENPSFILAGTDLTINYVSAFGRYYFATCKSLDGNRTQIDCTPDRMATFKSQVGAYTGLIEYTASSSKVDITDPRNQPTSLLTVTPTTLSFTSSPFSTTGTYILGTLGDSSNGETGVANYYRVTKAEMQVFAGQLYSTNVITQIINEFTNAMDSIVSCIWLPLDYIAIPGSPSMIHCGSKSVSPADIITDRVINFTTGNTAVNFSAISGGSGSSMTYLEKAPYCTGELYLPFIGFVPIDMDIMAFTKSIQVDGWVDVLTGDIAYKIYYGGLWVATYNGNIATKLPVTGASYDGIGVAAGTITAIGGTIATAVAMATPGGVAKDLLKPLAAVAGGAAAAAKSAELHTMINGNNSSALGAELGTAPYVLVHQYVPAETNLTAFQAEQGMPYFEVATVSGLSGYVKCREASVEIPGSDGDKQEVNDYMNSGFYYE